ncbi:aminotransferase class IV [Streptomyces megasporus]|uniref:aminotransferase class IV n=1 Tax=Streptomyces megasporus TaxID=44060 RepID=UPI0004E1810F|nr:aminotransferase class IV [Streptomyces megasporus]
MTEHGGEPVGLGDALQALALTNYGHFTSMRVERGRVRGLSLHLDRLVRDCRAVFDTRLDPERVREHIRRTVPREGSCVARVTVFDPALSPARIEPDARPHVLVTTSPAVDGPSTPLRVRTVTHTRDMPEVKNTGLFGSLRHRREARRAGFDDVLFVDGRGRVREGGTWNIGFIEGDRVVWPEADCLEGVTMRLLQRLHDDSTTAPVTLADAARFDAAFATNAVVGVRPVAALDDLVLPDSHPLIDELRDRYTALPGDPI